MRFASRFRSAATAVALLLATTLVAAGEVPFEKAAFDAAVAEGKPVIVDFSATWCPTCKAQKPIVQGLLREPKLKEVTLFLADYDTEKDLKKQLRVSQQSTFVVFKSGKEVARSTGVTDKGAIADLFDMAL